MVSRLDNAMVRENDEPAYAALVGGIDPTMSRNEQNRTDGIPASLPRQAGAADIAVMDRLTADLKCGPDLLVLARQDERNRLLRELHDAVGPALAGVALGLQVADGAIERDPAAARALLRKLGDELQSAIADIRRMAVDLRPLCLDQFGLITAIRERAAALTGRLGDGCLDACDSGVLVLIDTPDPLLALPVAVEVAAYRITCEAITNVTRHANARHCWVRIWLDGDLHLEIADDGQGISVMSPRGVGLTSMRERAEELGGECVVTRTEEGGTRVSARLPLPGVS
jgi:two-component system NarL family sensor kinase